MIELSETMTKVADEVRLVHTCVNLHALCICWSAAVAGELHSVLVEPASSSL